MADFNKEKEEAKKNIRSLLLSAPVGLTLDELRNDYEEFMGSRLPAEKFGYTNDEDFLRDLPDVVRMSRGPKGDLVLTATADESTKHIAKMVSKQRVDVQKWAATSTKRRRKSERGGRGRGRSLPGRGPPASRLTDPQQPRAQPPVPFFLRNKIQQFLEAYSGGVPLGDLEQAFYQKMGFRIEFERAGFRNLEVFLSKIPDIVKLSYLQHGEVRVEPAKSKQPPLMLKAQNVNSNNQKSRVAQSPQILPVINRNNSRQLSQQPQPQSQLPGVLRSQSYKGQSLNSQPQLPRSSSISSEPPGPLPRTRNNSSASQLSCNSGSQNNAAESKQAVSSSNSYTQLLSAPQPAFAGSSSTDTPRHYNAEEVCVTGLSRPQKMSGDISEQPVPISSALMEEMCEISPDLQDKIKQSLATRPKGIWASRLPFDFREKWKMDLPYRDLGFSSVIEFVSAMPHIVHAERPNPRGDWLLFDASKPFDINKENTGPAGLSSSTALQRGPQFLDDADGRRTKQVDKDEKLKESVRQVLQAHTDGVSLFHFKEIYQEMTGMRLDPEEYGMSDDHSLLLSLTSDVLRIEYQGQNISHLFALPTPGPCSFDYLLDCYKPHAIDAEADELYVDVDEECDQRIPEDAVGPGVCFTPVTLPRPDLSRADQSVDIHVSFVINPGLFWIQRNGKTFNFALDLLMDSLEEAYMKMGETYRMPETLMTYGQVCATLFPEDNNWHRGIITGRNDSGMIEVYFVDYGNTCFVAPNSIRFLRKRYLKLPAQAIQAQLAHVQPVGGKWPPEATEEMLNIVRAKPMVALITNIKGRVLSLCLTDTNANMDVHVNDLMVHKGYANFVEDIYEQELVSPPLPSVPAGQPLLLHDEHFARPGSVAKIAPVRSAFLRFVRQIDVTSDIGFHLINLQGSLYVMSSEVSALFWEDDILCSMLKQMNYNWSKMVVTRDQYPTLFQELLSYGVPNVDSSTEVLSLYSFSTLPLILEIFGNASQAITELSEAILEVLSNFSHGDPYWKGQDEEVVSVSQMSKSTTDQDMDIDDILTVEELQMALRSLQILRKRILKRMTVEAICTPSDITELEETENKIKQTHTLIETLEGSLASDAKTVPTKRVVSSSALTGLTSSVKQIPKLPKSLTSATNKAPMSTVKMNIVAPIVVQPPVSTAKPKVPPTLSVQDQTTIAQTAATNRQMEEIIRQQDQMLQSMLMMGWNPRLLNPASAASSPTLGLESLSISGFLNQPQTQPQLSALSTRFAAPGMANFRFPGRDFTAPASMPPGLQMPTPPYAGVPPGQDGVHVLGIAPPPVQPAVFTRMPSLLQPQTGLSLGYPFSVPSISSQSVPPLRSIPPGSQQATSMSCHLPMPQSFSLSMASHQSVSLGSQNISQGLNASENLSVCDPALKCREVAGSGVGGQGLVPGLPLAGSCVSLTRGQLLPSMLPLLQTLKANCFIRPPLSTASSQPPTNNLQL